MIQIINTTTLPDLVPDTPATFTLTFYQSGKIRLSAGLSAVMQVAQGDKIEFIIMDGRHYIIRGRSNGFHVSGHTAPSIHNINLIKALAKSLDMPLGKVNKVRMEVAQAPQYINGFDAFQIITTP